MENRPLRSGFSAMFLIFYFEMFWSAGFEDEMKQILFLQKNSRMDFFIDNQETEQQYQEVLHRIRRLRDGITAGNMAGKGILYKVNWGVSVVELRKLAVEIPPDHLLAMKLWNKKWRESMILATMVDVPAEVTEAQMDYWTKSFENVEIAEQAVANLWVKTPFAFIKALEWCRGKKHIVRYTGIQMIGRLSRVSKNDPDEMFEMFFSELATLAKDRLLSDVLSRTMVCLSQRSKVLALQVREFADELIQSGQEPARELGKSLSEVSHACRSAGDDPDQFIY